MNSLVRCNHERSSPSVFWESAVNCRIYTCFIWMGFCRVLDVKHDYIPRWSSIQFQSNHRVCTSVSLSPQQLFSFEKYDYLHDVYQYHFILDYWIYYQNIAAFTWSPSIYCSFLSSFITSFLSSPVHVSLQTYSSARVAMNVLTYRNVVITSSNELITTMKKIAVRFLRSKTTGNLTG